MFLRVGALALTALFPLERTLELVRICGSVCGRGLPFRPAGFQPWQCDSGEFAPFRRRFGCRAGCVSSSPVQNFSPNLLACIG